jgi:hypothetical protein
MPVGVIENKTYLHISLGKLRQKATEGAPNAQSRVNKDNKTVWEFVYNWVEGKIVSIYHKEDDKFGNSFEVTLDDNTTKYQVSFAEKSNFFQDFFSKLPNADLSKPIRIIPYDFEGENGRAIRGVTLMQDGVKIENYFVSKGDNGYEYKFDFPKPDNPKKMDKDDWKMYFIKVVKFLRAYIKSDIIPKMQNGFLNETVHEMDNPVPSINVEENDDLPF